MMQRRDFVIATGAALLAPLAIRPLALAGSLRPTPAQTAGPYYPRDKPADRDSDLVQHGAAPDLAVGDVVHLAGRLLDPAGRPLPGAAVEVWQADAAGRYRHPADRGAPDPNFQGYGATATDSLGGYGFRTIKPAGYGSGTFRRTPHIHFRITTAGGERLTTQMYFAGEPANARDVLYRGLASTQARDALTVAFAPAPDRGPGTLLGHFDIVMTGA